MKQNLCILIVGTIILLSSCGGSNKADNGVDVRHVDPSLIEVTKEQFSSMGMNMSPLQEKGFDAVIKASGRIDVPPKSRAKVTPYVGGYVKTISLLAGDKVAKGQALLTLESPEYIDLQGNYLEIAGRIEYFKSEYERQKTLFDEKISSQKRYLEAESDYKRVRAEYGSLRRKLELLNINLSQVEKGDFVNFITIYAPISGDITMVNANVGMAVSSSDVILEIVDNSFVHLELSVFEKDVFLLQKGQKLKFIVPQVNMEEFYAEVSVIGTSVQGNDRTINVYAALDDKAKQKLLTGMFVEAYLITASKITLCVPYEAVINEEGNRFLLVLDSENEESYTFRKTLIKTGERNGDFIEVIPDSNFNLNSNVLIMGVYDVI